MCGHFFEMTFSTSAIATTTVGVTLLGIDLGLVAMAIGAATGNRALAVGVTTAVAAASYLVSSLAPVVSAIEPFRYASLFYWAVGDNQMTDGLSLASVAVLAFTGIVAAIGREPALRPTRPARLTRPATSEGLRHPGRRAPSATSPAGTWPLDPRRPLAQPVNREGCPPPCGRCAT